MLDSRNAVCVRGLRKSFNKPAVRDIDLTIGAGEFYALLGPNGAGKTTTLRMVAGLLKPDAGASNFRRRCAAPIRSAAKRMIAWLPDEPMLYDKLDPLEYLEFVAGLWGVDADGARSEAEELLETLELWEHRAAALRGFFARHEAEGRRWPAR